MRGGSGTGGGGVVAVAEGSIAAAREEFRTPDWTDWVEMDADLTSASGPGVAPEASTSVRYQTGLSELDRVLGGGLVTDSFSLVGGDPGIGKSTLLLQMARGIVSAQSAARVLYVSGEESVSQIRSRARRLGIQSQGRIFLAAETQLERVFATVKELRPQVLILDSLQTFSSGYLESAPGSVSQLREVAARLMGLAKTAGIAVWLVGHVTKEGAIAGPKVVEHMVDTVLYFEGDGSHSYRLLRSIKNRFGSTQELGVFEMDSEGLQEVANPSSLFLSERQASDPTLPPVTGVAVTASLEGSRPLLVELQALVTPSAISMPRRTAVGLESTRVALVAAILEKHMRVRLADQDLFFNVAGGLRLSEPAVDLAAAAAIWSSFAGVSIAQDMLLIGELGLTGEVRRVPQIEVRLQEAKKLGFARVIVPAATPERALQGVSGLRVERIQRVVELASKLEQLGSRLERPVKRETSSRAARPIDGATPTG